MRLPRGRAHPLDQCSFVRAPADSLGPIADASVDVVTTRSVLIYVKDKAAALREFYRVVRPGGRVSLFEPINRLMRDPDDWFLGYDTRPVAALADKVRAVYDAIQPRDCDPMGDFDERDLVRHAESAGFPEVSLDLRLSLKPGQRPCAWETFLRTSGNPLVPPLGEVMEQVLSAEEVCRVYRSPQASSRVGSRPGAIGTCLPDRREGLGRFGVPQMPSSRTYPAQSQSLSSARRARIVRLIAGGAS